MPAGSQQSLRSTGSGSGQSTQEVRTDRQPDAGDHGDAEKLSPSQPPPDSGDGELFKPRSVRFWLTLLCNFLALFLVALDRTIIATAVPRISDEFNALGDIGWYGSSYMLTTACAQLLFGRLYKFYDMKWTFLTSIIVFEIGSAICGAAANSTTFIVGRAIAGLGSAGIFAGCLLIMIPMVPLHRRPAFQGMFGMVFGLASVMGPLIGGGFTGGVTWRWCFYINLPIGAVTLVFMVLYWNPPKRKHEPAKFTTHVKRLDPLGMLFFLPGVVCLFIAFQWGGSTYAWNEWRIIVLLVVFAACIVAFTAVQILKPETASVPPKVFMQRSVLFGNGFTFFLAGSMLMLVYYMPVWFQTVKQVDPLKSGIYTLPLVLSLVVSSILSGGITQRIGYYVPSMLVSPSVMAIGEGLLTLLNQDSPTSHWVCFQFLSGFGLGFGMQTSGLAVQTVLPKEDVPAGIAINFFVQQLGGAVFTSVGQAILTNTLVSQLSGLPGVDPHLVVNEGATKLAHLVPPEEVGLIINAYNDACRNIFFASMGLAFASLSCAFGMEWKSVKRNKLKVDASSSSSNSNNLDSSTAGAKPGMPYFEGIKENRKRKSSGGSRKSRGPGRKGVLTKAPPPERSRSRPCSSTMLSQSSGDKKDNDKEKDKKEDRKDDKKGDDKEDVKKDDKREEKTDGDEENQKKEDNKDDKNGQMSNESLAGALRDWVRYSMAQEAEEEEPQLGGF
ncbi:MFS general substrate transporter [Parathielavia appendiculata]|uniref:MFS general substrate transporter n=1 Tax=Parathielavia appendiculata TaxID=2587402 RepID=A0AAN6U560_9PEZI|nr:MFS general substrate transporter [Parathielavia appendiculata]